MEKSIGRIEAHVEHIQFDVTDLRQDMKTVLWELRGTRPDDPRIPFREPTGMQVPLHDFPDLGLIVKAATGIIYSNQAGGFASLHREAEGFFVPLQTGFGMRDLHALQGHFARNSRAVEDIDDESANRLEWILERQGLKCIRVDRAKLADSCEAWVHVRLSRDMENKLPLEGSIPSVLEAVLIWPNCD